MGKMIHVRGVSERLHRALVRAAHANGQTLTDYVRAILAREVARAPAGDVFDRIAARPSVNLGRSAAELIHEERAARKGS